MSTTKSFLPDIEPATPTINLDDCKVMIVGEAPGRDEVIARRPFVGKAGKVLDQVLEQVGMIRDHLYITNVFWTRPPDNKVDHFFVTATEARKGRPHVNGLGNFRTKILNAEYQSEIERLFEEVTIVQPDVILALGATPLWALTGCDKISQLRGRKLPLRIPRLESVEYSITEDKETVWNNTKVVATWHPAYVLRNKNSLEDVIEDVKSVLPMLNT